jgi:hypothetical protein
MTSDDLCGLGEKGWELVSVAATTGDSGSHTVLHYFFKREAPAPQEETR